MGIFSLYRKMGVRRYDETASDGIPEEHINIDSKEISDEKSPDEINRSQSSTYSDPNIEISSILHSRIFRGVLPLIIIVLTKMMAGFGPLYYFFVPVYMIPLCIHMMWQASIQKGNEYIYLKERIFLEKIRTSRFIPYAASIIISFFTALLLPGFIFYMTLAQVFAFVSTIPITYLFLRVITMDRFSKYKHNSKPIMLSGRKQVISSFFACLIYPMFQLFFIELGMDNQTVMYEAGLTPLADEIGIFIGIMNDFSNAIINAAESTGIGMLVVLVVVYTMSGGFTFFMILKFFGFFFFDKDRIEIIRMSVRDVAMKIVT